MSFLSRLLNDDSRPRHRPKKYLSHLADEYEALGDVQTAHELRRHLRGHSDDLARYLRVRPMRTAFTDASWAIPRRPIHARPSKG